MNSYKNETDYKKKRKYYGILFIIFSCMGIMFMILFGYFLLFSNIENENIQILLVLISFLASCITLTQARGCEENINSLAGEHLIRKGFEEFTI